MSLRLAPVALVLILTSIPACDDGSGGEGGAGGSGADGGGAGPTGPSSGTAPWAVTTGPGALRSPQDICRSACDCDASCSANAEPLVRDCVDRFGDEQRTAALADCDAEYAAYHACFSETWSCGDPEACDEATDALSACVASLCLQANELCGCSGCASSCGSREERCWSTCIVEAGTCEGEDEAFYTCIDGCYGGDEGSSVGAGGWAAASE